MKQLFIPLLILLLVPACQLTPPRKSAKAKKVAEVVKPQPMIVLIPPELLGQECIVQERVEDEKTTRTYTGKLLKFDDEVIELETPRVTSKVDRDHSIFGAFVKNSAVGSLTQDENKTLTRLQVASIKAIPTPSE